MNPSVESAWVMQWLIPFCGKGWRRSPSRGSPSTVSVGSQMEYWGVPWLRCRHRRESGPWRPSDCPQFRSLSIPSTTSLTTWWTTPFGSSVQSPKQQQHLLTSDWTEPRDLWLNPDWIFHIAITSLAFIYFIFKYRVMLRQSLKSIHVLLRLK